MYIKDIEFNNFMFNFVAIALKKCFHREIKTRG